MLVLLSVSTKPDRVLIQLPGSGAAKVTEFTDGVQPPVMAWLLKQLSDSGQPWPGVGWCAAPATASTVGA